MKVFLVSTNPTKVMVARTVIPDLNQLAISTPEIQSSDVMEIAKYSAKWAADNYKKAVLKSDKAFCIDALGGFPGPYAAYAEKTLGTKGIMKLMSGVENRKAKYMMAVAYCEPGKKPVAEYDELPGKIAENTSGEFGWFTDHFFIPDGYEKPMGCYPDAERKRIWPNRVWEKIKLHFMNK